MSRIYDALKKAEQESRLRSSTAIAQPVEAEPNPKVVAESPAAQETKAAGSRPSPGPAASALTSQIPVAEPAIAVSGPPISSVPATPPLTSGGAVPQAPQAKPPVGDKPIEIFSHEGRELRGAEELRRLRTKLQHAREKAPLRSLLITSALPGEGKTFIALNLARTLTMQHHSRVLVIDADLRKPQLHLELGTANETGLAEYLEGSCDADTIIRPTRFPSLSIITGGRVSTRAAELAGSARFAELLAGVTEQFEWVIVDTSPVIPVTDAAVLARMCDATLLVVAAARTPGDIAQAAQKELREANILGVVLNRAQRSSSSYHNYYYYEAYSDAGAGKARAASAQ